MPGVSGGAGASGAADVPGAGLPVLLRADFDPLRADFDPPRADDPPAKGLGAVRSFRRCCDMVGCVRRELGGVKLWLRRSGWPDEIGSKEPVAMKLVGLPRLVFIRGPLERATDSRSTPTNMAAAVMH